MTDAIAVPSPANSTLALPHMLAGDFTRLTDLEQAIIGFLARYKGGTLKEFTRDLQLFLRWCQLQQVEPLAAKRGQLQLYVRWLGEQGWAEATVARRVGTMRLFYKFCAIDEYVDRDPSLAIERPKVDYTKQHRTHLSPVELAAFLQAAERMSRQHHALASVMGLAALRVGEVTSLNMGSLSIEGGFDVLRFIGKGNKAAAVQLPVPISRALLGYMDGRGPTGPLFVNSWGARMDRRTVANHVLQTCVEAGVRTDITPHSLRRSCATALLSMGVPLVEVQALLRHASPNTTVRCYDSAFEHRGNGAANAVTSFVTTLQR